MTNSILRSSLDSETSLPWKNSVDPSWYRPANPAVESTKFKRHYTLSHVANFWPKNSSMENGEKLLLKAESEQFEKEYKISERSTMTRIKRGTPNWFTNHVEGSKKLLKMHAFIVKDASVPECGEPAPKKTFTRFFMCSGVVLTQHQVLTSASCMNHADIHNHFIQGDLAVLVGGIADPKANSYVMKINTYEINPSYNPNLGSKKNYEYNLAMVTVSCPFPGGSALIPKFPSKPFSDVGHTCCPNRCNLTTVVTHARDHQHFLEILSAKHLPRPIHEDEESLDETPSKQSQGSDLDSPIDVEDSDKDQMIQREERHVQKPFNQYILQNRGAGGGLGFKSYEGSSFTTLKKIFRRQAADETPAEGTPVEDHAPKENAAANTDAVEHGAAATAATEAEHSSTTTATEAGHGSTTVVTTVKPSTTSSTNCTKDDDELDFVREYVYCPPLGSPIVSGGVLIALISYTCDDEQPTTPWEYVNIQKNMPWIDSQISQKLTEKKDEDQESTK
ncbi:hypothetical protein QAD02_004471 [Eretmocerus hayati]|uniref:Uncharacterized protein n=1 Tax=Eretmocerus hayati TaxID=131215 RepID=A0ACC2NPL9_9HYME|nr:hypothetical protein QAD02_004471 [Eretmocerus hayati]